MTSTVFGKAWALMVLALVVVESIFLGSDLGTKNGKGAIVDVILLVFWVFTLVWIHFFTLHEQKMDIKFRQAKKDLDDSFGKLIDDLKEDLDHDAKNAKALNQAHLETIGDRTAKPSEFKRVEARFHEITGDHYLQLAVVKGDNRPSATIGDKPFTAKKSVVKKAPVKKTVTTKKGK